MPGGGGRREEEGASTSSCPARGGYRLPGRPPQKHYKTLFDKAKNTGGLSTFQPLESDQFSDVFCREERWILMHPDAFCREERFDSMLSTFFIEVNTMVSGPPMSLNSCSFYDCPRGLRLLGRACIELLRTVLQRHLLRPETQAELAPELP